ncbi:MAG: HNH endonuclease [Nitrospira sp.]|nr:HNH endonuclease [Nitrospira sp.]
MRFWWVNQNQTFRHEIGGGYLWSPKRSAGERRNPFYEFMREVSPGDVIVSFCDTRIAALGIAQSYCYESPKPDEFGTAGLSWSAIGWKVEVRFQELSNRIRPKNYIRDLLPFLPEKYSPLQKDGNGLQSVYLTELNPDLAGILFRLIGQEAEAVRDTASALHKMASIALQPEATLQEWEQRVERGICDESSLPETEKQSLIQARRGQGLFRANVQRIERQCRITKVDRPEHLIASHCKPWRDSTNDERLDGENGLLLTPTIDHLFDKGFISFEGNGRLIISPVAHRPSLIKMGIDVDHSINVGAFNEGQRRFLDYHQENVLRMARQAGR